MTELGLDSHALCDADRDTYLFDLGLNTLQVDVCIRSRDADLLSAMRMGEGRPLFDHASPALPAILKASPHRVFLTRIGRGEVYQPIPSDDQPSPDGPHTHLLPKLLRSGRTHAATNPIPAGYVPCAHLYPAHPRKDVMGRVKPFDRSQHDRFQTLLASFGNSELNDIKQQVIQGVVDERDPETLAVPENRFARATMRVALRQRLAMAGPSPSLIRWRQLHDRAAEVADIADEGEQSQHG